MSRCTSLETEVFWNQQGLPGRDGNDGSGEAVGESDGVGLGGGYLGGRRDGEVDHLG